MRKEFTKKNGADLLAQTLASLRVAWIATLCGHGLNEIYAACARAGIRLIDTRNEQTASYMAESWGRMSRAVGVCAVSSGVAHANALAGVVNADFDGSPMLLITGAGPLNTAGRGHFQEFDQVGLASPVCKYTRVLDTPDLIPEQVREAFEHALSGRPGPVHLTFPIDVQEAIVDVEVLPSPLRLVERVCADECSIAEATTLLADAQRPLVVAGSGVYYAGAGEALASFCASFAIPFVIPIWDRGCAIGKCIEYLGVIGAASGDPDLLCAADLILMVGAAADYRVGYLQPPAIDGEASVIRIDLDVDRLRHLQSTEVKILAHPVAAIEQLGACCSRQQIVGFDHWLSEARSCVQSYRSSVVASADRTRGMHALDIVEVVADVMDEETTLIVDGGNIGQWFHQIVARDHYSGSVVTCGASGVVGYGIGAAMAACTGDPMRSVILISGDGAATFNLADLECAARQQLPFVMIVADDESWGITESGHLKRYSKAMSSHLGPINFVEAARAFGAVGARIENRDELASFLHNGSIESVPTLIHVPISGGMPEG